MKQHIYWLFFILLLTGCNNKIKAESYDGIVFIPDSIFKSFLVAEFDTDGDGEISKSEAEAVAYIDVYSRGKGTVTKEIVNIDAFSDYKDGNGIRSLEGIEHFTSLIELRCQFNELEILDISRNENLEYLECYENQLTHLDVSKNLKLKKLICSYNKLSELDVSNNRQLTNLSCDGNKLTQLNVSENLKLKRLECGYNQLTNIDLSPNKELTVFYCSGNELTGLDITKNISLETLGCAYTQLTDLDVSHNILLESLYCNNNELDSLNLQNTMRLKYLVCHTNRLTHLDVSNNYLLERLICGYNQLTELDLCYNKELRVLSCRNNKLKKLNIKNNTELVNLYYAGNPVAKLDVSKHNKLVSVNRSDMMELYRPNISRRELRKKPLIIKIIDEKEAQDPDIQAQVFSVLHKRMHYTGRDSNLVQQTKEGYFSIIVPEATNQQNLKYMLTKNTDVKIFKTYDFRGFDTTVMEINKLLLKDNISYDRLIDSVLRRPPSSTPSFAGKSKYYPLISIFSIVTKHGPGPAFFLGSTEKWSYIPAINQCFGRPDVKKLLPPNVILKWDELPEKPHYHLYALQTNNEGNAYLDRKHIIWADAAYFSETAKIYIRLKVDNEGILKLKRLAGQWLAIVANDKVIGMSKVDDEINNGYLVIHNHYLQEYNTTDAKNIIMKVRNGKVNLPVALQVE